MAEVLRIERLAKRFGKGTRAVQANVDIDLLVEADGEVGGLAFGSFIADVEELTGFPVDVVVDRPGNRTIDAIRETAVPL